MHERGATDGAALADLDVIGFEHAFLQGVALERGSFVEVRVVADLDQRLLEELAAVVEDLAAHPDAEQAGDHAFEGRPVE
jgi:hypothetical protein